MIFVTVGTHEQPFDRLIGYMDKWAAEHDEEVVMQRGYASFVPEHCESKPLFSYEEMQELTDRARIVITHGGPSTIMMVLCRGKVPVVVPRRHDLGEHVNDHQVVFCDEYKELEDRFILIGDIDTLESVIDNYDEQVKEITAGKVVSHTKDFCDGLSKIVDQIFE